MRSFAEADYAKIEYLMPKLRKPNVISSCQFLCALLYLLADRDATRKLSKQHGFKFMLPLKKSRKK